MGDIRERSLRTLRNLCQTLWAAGRRTDDIGQWRTPTSVAPRREGDFLHCAGQYVNERTHPYFVRRSVARSGNTCRPVPLTRFFQIPSGKPTIRSLPRRPAFPHERRARRCHAIAYHRAPQLETVEG